MAFSPCHVLILQGAVVCVHKADSRGCVPQDGNALAVRHRSLPKIVQNNKIPSPGAEFSPGFGASGRKGGQRLWPGWRGHGAGSLPVVLFFLELVVLSSSKVVGLLGGFLRGGSGKAQLVSRAGSWGG